MAKLKASLKPKVIRYIVKFVVLISGAFLPLFGSQVVQAADVNIQDVLNRDNGTTATNSINTAMPLAVESAADPTDIANGTFGNGNGIWNIDANGQLNINSLDGLSAYLPEISLNGNQVVGRPWEPYINQIKSVYVGERVMANYKYSNYLFAYMPNVTSIDVGNFSIIGVTSLKGMFSSDPNLTSMIGLENWDTSNVTDMSSLFRYSKALKDIYGIKDWDTSSLEDMYSMFADTKITDFSPISDWNVSKLQSVGDLFENNPSVQSIELNWDTSSINNLIRTFSGCTNLIEIKGLDKFNTKNFNSLSYAFNGDSKLASLKGIENWDTSNISDMSSTFNMCKSLKSLDLSNWITSKVTNMNSMFNSDSNFNEITLKGLDKFDTSNVSDMSSMFSGTGFTELNLENFNTSKLTKMGSMFGSTKKLKKIDGTFDTTSVESMYGLFNGSSISDFSRFEISKWNTSKVTTMESMFKDTPGIKDLDLSSWDTANVKSYSMMFNNASALESIDISNFDMTNAEIVSYMFYSMPKLWKVTFGPKSFLHLSKPDNGHVNKIYLDTPVPGRMVGDTTYSAISDKWQAEDAANGGTDNAPSGNLLSPGEIENIYTTAGGPKETYVWQQQPKVDLKMSVPNIDFGRTYNSAGLVKRSTPFAVNVINDSYPTDAIPATIDVSMDHPLTDINDESKILNDVLIFKGQDNAEKILSSTDTEIYNGDIANGSNDLSWDDDHGILLNMNNDRFAKNGHYSTTLNWTLTNSL